MILATIMTGCAKEPKTFQENLAAGKKAYVKQDYKKARDYLGRAVTMNPSERTSLYFLGRAYESDGMYDSAYFYLGRADVLFPNDREINTAIYNVAMNIGEWGAVRKAINVLIQTGDPANAYYVELAHLNVADTNYVLAYRYFRLALQDSLDSPSRWLDVANSAAQIDSLDVAVRVIDSAITKFGPRKEFLMNKGLYLSGKEDYPAAEKIFRQLAEEDTTQVAYRLNLANTLASQDSRAKKEEAYRIYQQLRSRVGKQFNLDSLTTALGQELGKN